MTKNILSSRPRILYMDFLRGLAILYIVGIRHLDDYAGNVYNNKLDDVLTYVCLGLFIFLSGYLLSINNPIRNRNDLLEFIAKRLLRIYPLYILALLLFMFCSIMTFKSLMLHMFLINVVIDSSVMTLWFASMICIFYFFYPIIAYKYSILKTILFFIILSILVLFLNKTFGLFDIRLMIYLPLFIFGIVSCKHNLIEKYFFKKNIVIFSILLFAVTNFLYFRIYEMKKLFLTLFLISSIPALLLIGNFFSTIIAESIYKKIAYASFCMYLFHRVIFHLMTTIYSPSSNTSMVFYLSIIGVPVIFATSFYFQKYYDQLTNRWRRTLKN